jgi:hypothetical protein
MVLTETCQQKMNELLSTSVSAWNGGLMLKRWVVNATNVGFAMIRAVASVEQC